MTRTPRVVVLGCGPAGLIAAHTVRSLYSGEVICFSVKRPSDLYGCQYLHAPIPDTPGWDEDGQEVDYRLLGDTEVYRAKVYGSLTPPVSPEKYEGNHWAWDLRKTYSWLWETYESCVQDVKVRPEDVKPMLAHLQPDLMVSSIPLPALCQAGSRHTFQSVPCWALGDAPDRGQFVRDRFPIKPFTVLCNGSKDVSWYRLSNVFDYATVEWPGHKRKPPVEGVAEFRKPLSNDCDCLPDVLRVGRYGQWQKGVLSHETYERVVKAMGERGF